MTANELIGSAFIYLGLFIIFFVVKRIWWVKTVRMQLIENDFNELLILPSGRRMFWRFWIWDVNKFLK